LSKLTEIKTINSPCIGLCDIDFDFTDICRGCGRSIDEIADWSSYTDENKILVNEKAMQRMKENNS
jgi:hypothetical protein|tara:strand:+ start:1275 stop:1472 length:198 start_codon:yes stop_codon:yes gene_type:complete